jgi:hypothetical protein
MAYQPYPDSARLRTFICHASNDKPDARIVFDLLRLAGAEPWLDEKKLKAGVEWDPFIIRAVRESDAVVILLSRASVDKEGYVQKEIRVALEQAQSMPEGVNFVFPLKLEECQPPEKVMKYQVATRFEQILEALQDRARLKQRGVLRARRTREHQELRGRLRQIAEERPHLGTMVAEVREPATVGRPRRSAPEPREDLFRALYRRAVRTSASQAEVETFNDLASLLETLPADEAIRPKIGPTTPRTPEEDRNVSVRARLHAIKKQHSNDYSLIIGKRARRGAPIFMVCRVSGLPTEPGPNRILLSYMRATFRDLFEGVGPVSERYSLLNPPRPVTVTGSLFFNGNHKPGEVGPAAAKALKTTTSWEIQPVLSMYVDE